MGQADLYRAPAGTAVLRAGHGAPSPTSLTLSAPAGTTVNVESGIGYVTNTGTRPESWALSVDRGAALSVSGGLLQPGQSASYTVTPIATGGHLITLANVGGGLVFGSPASMASSADSITPAAFQRSAGEFLFQPGLKERTYGAYKYTHEGGGGGVGNVSGLLTAAPTWFTVDELSDWEWTNPGGDWLDAAGTPQGSANFNTYAMNAGGFQVYPNIDVTALVRWIEQTGWWNAWRIGRGASTSRTIGGLYNTDPAKRPQLTVVYTDATSEVLTCRITSGISSGSSTPSSFAATYPLPCFIEFERPKKPVQSATLSLYQDTQWSGTQPITFNPLNPPTQAAELPAGIAAAYTQDDGLAAAAGVIYAHNLADGTAESDVISSTNYGMFDWEFDPKLWNDALTADTSKVPWANYGKWINKDPGGDSDPMTLVSSSYTGEGFEPLAPGLGALHVKIKKAAGLVDGMTTDSSGQTGAVARMFLPFDRIGLTSHVRSRFYIRFHRERDLTWNDRLMNPNTDGVWQATNYTGKFGPGWCHDTSEFGFSGSSGSGGGWQWRKQWATHLHGVAGPAEGGVAFGTHIKSDFIANSPINYSGYRENWGDNGVAGNAMPDVWYLIEDEFKLNSLTSNGLGFLSDGEYRVWMAPIGQTPKLVFERTGLAIRSNPVHRGSIGLPVAVPGAGNAGSVTFANNMGMLAVSTPAKSGPTPSAFAVTLNMGSPFAPGFAIAELITLTFDGAGGYTVSGSVHGAYSPGTVGVAYVSANGHKWTVTGAPVLGNAATINFEAQPYSPQAAIPEVITLTFDGAGGYTAVGSFYGTYAPGTVGAAYVSARRHKWEIGGSPANGDTLTITFPEGSMVGRTSIRELGIRDVMINMFHGGKTESPIDIDWFIAGFAYGDATEMAGPFGHMTGLGPPVQITGSAWTPNRSGDAVMQTDFPQFPANTWLTVAGTDNKLRDVAESPTLPNSGGGDSFVGVVQAWSGAAWDEDRDAMLIPGGGHTDTSARDTAVFEVSADSMRAKRVVDRQAPGTALKFSTSPTYTGQAQWTNLVAGEPWLGGANLPLSNGVPGSNHSSGMVEWIPPSAMSALGLLAPVRGGLWLGGITQALLNLDTGAYSQTHYVVAGYPAGNITMGSESSLTHWMRDGTKLLGIRGGSSPWMTFDLAQSEMTLWQLMAQCTNPATPSLGKYLANKSNSACSTLVTWATIVKMRERREMVFFQAIQADYTAKRVRYGQGVDAAASDLAAYTDAISLTSDNGTDHLDFSAANFRGYYGHNLNHAGSFYDHVDGCIWICANDAWQGTYDAGGEAFTPGTTHPLTVYKITGASGSLDNVTWKVKKLAGAQPLTISPNGTWGRFIVVHRGAERIGMRISGVDNPIEVIRLVSA